MRFVQQYARIPRSIRYGFWLVFLPAIIAGFWIWTVRGYGPYAFGLHSSIAPSLRVFFYNQSKHRDPVPGCWYDAGDYVVFLNRNAEALWYLSIAYREARQPAVKADLMLVIDQQLMCVQEMISQNWKQFRDMKSHGPSLPPVLNELFFPQTDYQLRVDEGKDVYLLLGLTMSNIGRKTEAESYFAEARLRTNAMVSEQCCEEGPHANTALEMSALESIAGWREPPTLQVWDLSFPTVALLESENNAPIRDLLGTVSKEWQENGIPFQYLGGNYDIAGTIALERLYEARTNDAAFASLSDQLMRYLEGKNDKKINFTKIKKPFHPCGFFGWCRLSGTLVNGVDTSGTFQESGYLRWRFTEIQLVGQAKYVLARVLFEGL
ncbi:MAG: hypothetical protein Q8P82_02210 [bacterium]|nr:hypothetical protein [bacterium]